MVEGFMEQGPQKSPEGDNLNAFSCAHPDSDEEEFLPGPGLVESVKFSPILRRPPFQDTGLDDRHFVDSAKIREELLDFFLRLRTVSRKQGLRHRFENGLK